MKKSGGGWSQGPALSSQAYYLTEYKAYNDCYPEARPGAIQSGPNPELAQTPMAGGRRKSRINRRNKKSKSKSKSKKRSGGNGGKRKTMKGGRYMVDTATSIGGDGPNVAPVISNFPCEAYRPMPINPHQPTELVSGPDPDLRFAGLSPASVMNGGHRKYQKKE